MSLPVVTYVLTALAAVVVVLTRLRMRGGQGAGRVYVGRRLLDVHTVAGGLAVVLWTIFLIAPKDNPLGSSTMGIIGLGLFWVMTFAGLLILVRWLPSRGRHASAAVRDRWSEGPGLSMLAHVGMLAGVVVLTYAYLTSAV